MRIFFILLLACCICGCGRKEGRSVERTLHISFMTEITTLDPRIGANNPTAHAIRMLFDGLFRPDKDGVIAPAVAESYVVSEDFKTYTFKLRKSVWSDGEPVTAYDFEYAWKKVLNPETIGHGAHNFYFIKNAQKSAEGKISIEEVGVKALDAQTLQVELEYPVSYILNVFSSSLFYPIPKHLDTKEPSWSVKTDETFVSNGPFRLKRWQRSNFLEVIKNKNYWDEKNVHLSSIKIQFDVKDTTGLFMYEKKEVDWLGEPLNPISLDAIDTMRKDPTYTSVEGPTLFWYFVNVQKFPFTNKKLRQALAYAINRQELVDHIYYGEAKGAQGIVAPYYKMGNSPCFEDGNREKAEVLFGEALEELGLTRESFPIVTIKYPENRAAFHRICQAIQQYWEQAFGIEVVLQKGDWPIYFKAIQKGDYEIGLMGWYAFIVDPIYMLQTFKYKDDLVNMSNWQSEEYVNLLEASHYEIDTEKRKKILIKAERVLMDEMPVIPLYFIRQTYLKNPALIGVNLPPSGEIDFKFASFSR